MVSKRDLLVHLSIQSALCILILLFSFLASRQANIRLIEATLPRLQSTFYSNAKSDFAAETLVLAKTIGTRAEATTRNGQELGQYEFSESVFQLPYVVPIRLSENSPADATITLHFPIFQPDSLTFAIWFLIALGASGGYLLWASAKSVSETRRIELVRASALANMISAISHDVRKPFSLFKIVLEQVRQIRSTDEMHSFANQTLPEVEQAMQSVEGLLADVMQVNSGSFSLVQEPVALNHFVDAIYSEIFKAQPEADVTIETELERGLSINIDEPKVKRIFLNIIQNACQAIGWKGKIWVKAHQNAGRVHFVLGNAGSFIPEEVIPKLFESFFTSNKKGGTGLGLAIAQKWTEAHGGKIQCRSWKDAKFPNGAVEFTFDLPAAAPGSAPEKIPATHSSAYKLSFTFDEPSAKVNEAMLAKLQSRLANRSLRIITVDDEDLYLQGIQNALSQLKLGAAVECEARKFAIGAQLQDAALIILDYDLGRVDKNGLDIIKEYRASGGAAHICLHTNRADSETSKKAIEAGANTVYPKPIDPNHLGRLILEVLGSSAEAANKLEATKHEQRKLRVALVEDSFIFRMGWRRSIGADCELVEFASPEEFKTKATEPFDILITDMHFDGSVLSGVDVAQHARTAQLAQMVLLSSNGEYDDAGKLFDAQLSKDQAYSLDDLRGMKK